MARTAEEEKRVKRLLDGLNLPPRMRRQWNEEDNYSFIAAEETVYSETDAVMSNMDRDFGEEVEELDFNED